MKRSQINDIIRQADAFLRERRFYLPPFAFWSPQQWRDVGQDGRQIVERALGWDITDFGRGQFERFGLVLFTIRNGVADDLKKGKGELYCEKMLIGQVDQITPLHFHWTKTEDIINRGGGKLVVQLYNATEDGQLMESDVLVVTDGLRRSVPAGGAIVLSPGESITLVPYCYHAFWAVEEPVLIGEVSLVNDDAHDNRFYEPVGRFPEIEEDEAPHYLLVGDYAAYWSDQD